MVLWARRWSRNAMSSPQFSRASASGRLVRSIVSAEPFVDPDWESTGALIGEIADEIVALASYARLRDPTSAEVAFSVAEAYQGRGIGTNASMASSRGSPQATAMAA